jgi:hypothetical protein
MPSALVDDVTAFVAAVAAELAALSGKPATTYTREVVVEAADLVAGVLDADGRFTDGELAGYLEALGPLLDPPLLISSAALRDTRILSGKATVLAAPSTLFDLLVRADAHAGSTRSHRYYEQALRLCHVAASLDLVPSPDEIRAIDVFRDVLLRHMDSLDVRRPGQLVPAAAAGQPTVDTVAQPAATVAVRPLPELFAQLDLLVGLANVKAEIRRLSSLLQVQQLRAERGLRVIETSHHLVFTGNPGTGKTTVARLLSQIYHSIGVVSKGQLVETDRSKLVAGYVGQTALKTQEALESSLGGTLLIDEAYALARGGENDFGREAIDTLVKFMEDHRDDLAIVAAGYPTEMADFIDTNPGLKSRFTRTVLFPDYTDDELTAIFLKLCDANGYACTDDALSAVRHLITIEPRTRGFGNARFVRNLFETAVGHQAMRVAPLTDPSDEQLSVLTADDIAPVDA